MGTKKSAFWVWLKPYASKALKEMKDEYGEETVRKLCGKWVRVDAPNADGGFACKGLDGDCILREEVAKAVESDTRPVIPWCPAPEVSRLMGHKAKATVKPKAKATWTPKTVFTKFPPRTTRSDVERMLRDAVDEINELGTENAKLKNQIAKLKGAK